MGNGVSKGGKHYYRAKEILTPSRLLFQSKFAPSPTPSLDFPPNFLLKKMQHGYNKMTHLNCRTGRWFIAFFFKMVKYKIPPFSFSLVVAFYIFFFPFHLSWTPEFDPHDRPPKTQRSRIFEAAFFSSPPSVSFIVADGAAGSVAARVERDQ